MNTHDFATDVVGEAMKGAPPVAVTTGALVGLFDLDTIVALSVLIYTVLQAAFLIWKWRRLANGATDAEG
jgi:hypothetical protein